ncbi:Nitrous oxide reductase maturation periplasmic pro tein NosX [Devosia sp. DBB001]|nr:Nitrous oxide reductase maturation periplasmic pro tein NosX [Devosia sp. DBB001]
MHRTPQKWSRRRTLAVLGATLALPLGAAAAQRYGRRPDFVTWQGESLGGPAKLMLWHEDEAFARNTITRMRSEIERLENVFSLFRTDSEIAQLNRNGLLSRPSQDMATVLSAACDIAHTCNGAFDPTVQPLWRLYETHFRSTPSSPYGPSAPEIAAAQGLVNYSRIDIGTRTIRFAEPGMAVTLNGIAQGYITDRIADLLREEGFDHTIVDVGETRALGTQPDGAPWSVAIVNPLSPSAIGRAIDLENTALSVSGGYGQRFGRSTSHHIFDPATGLSANRLLDVAIVAPRAMLADGLSTALFVGGEDHATALLKAYPGIKASGTRLDGTVFQTA